MQVETKKRAAAHYGGLAELARLHDVNVTLQAAIEQFLCEEVVHLVVNGHRLREEVKAELTAALMKRLPDIYETARLALVKAQS